MLAVGYARRWLANSAPWRTGCQIQVAAVVSARSVLVVMGPRGVNGESILAAFSFRQLARAHELPQHFAELASGRRIDNMSLAFEGTEH